MKKGDYVTNNDSCTGKVLDITMSGVRFEFIKCGKKKVETWNIYCIRLANQNEIDDYISELSDFNSSTSTEEKK